MIKLEAIGNLGGDAIEKNINGQQYISFSVTVTERYKKADGTYWMITSGCTGWAPNTARMFSAPSIWGPWTQHPNPCVGPNADLTFGGQSTFVLPIPGKQDAFLFMADIWRPEHPSDARYIWLPIDFTSEPHPVIRWTDRQAI